MLCPYHPKSDGINPIKFTIRNGIQWPRHITLASYLISAAVYCWERGVPNYMSTDAFECSSQFYVSITNYILSYHVPLIMWFLIGYIIPKTKTSFVACVSQFISLNAFFCLIKVAFAVAFDEGLYLIYVYDSMRSKPYINTRGSCDRPVRGVAVHNFWCTNYVIASMSMKVRIATLHFRCQPDHSSWLIRFLNFGEIRQLN